jgi:hypothetical protein
MYWYDFGRYEIYAGSGGNFRHSDCKTISQDEKQKIADFFSTRLLKIYFEDTRSYDNSDDERVSDSYSRSNSYVYREVDVEQDLYGLVMKDGEIKGVVFYVKNNSRDVYAKVFNFDGQGINETKEIYDKERLKKITAYLPGGSLIGRLFDHPEKQKILHSECVSVYQHDAFSWEIVGKDFVYEKHFLKDFTHLAICS